MAATPLPVGGGALAPPRPRDAARPSHRARQARQAEGSVPRRPPTATATRATGRGTVGATALSLLDTQSLRRPVSRPAQGRPQLRAVPMARTRPQVLPSWLYGAMALTILAVGVLGIVALNALAAEASFEARTLEADISDMTLRHDDLVAAVATLASPGRVREVAVGQLGLIEPEQPGFLTLNPDQLLPPTPKAQVRLGE